MPDDAVFLTALRRLEKSDDVCTFSARAWEWWGLLVMVQLACRHPGTKGSPTRKIVEALARRIQDTIAAGDQDLARLAEQGWHEVFDR